MASGFCESILLLSLISVWQLAAGNPSRYRSRNLGPYSAEAGTLPRSYQSIPSSYRNVPQPRSSANAKFPGSLPEASNLWGSIPSKGQSDYRRRVNGYSQPGSVSSYRSASALAPQQQHGLQRKPGLRDPSSQGGKRYGSSVVSSGAIEIHAPPQQQSGSPGTPSGPPSQHPAFSAPAVLQTKDAMWDTVKLPSAKSPGTPSGPPSQHPAFSAPAVLQTKDAMWDTVNLPSAKSPLSASGPPSDHPAFSAPAVLQSNADMWSSVHSPSAKNPASTARRNQHSSPVPALLQASQQLPNIYPSGAQSRDSTVQRHQKPAAFLAPTVLQTKQTWGTSSSPNPRGSRPAAPGHYPRGLQSGRHAAQQQARLPAHQPQLGSPSKVLQNTNVRTKTQMKPGPRSFRPANVASHYEDGSWQPQLSYNRN